MSESTSVKSPADKAVLESLLIPADQLKGAKRWSPATLQAGTASAGARARANDPAAQQALREANAARQHEAAVLKAKEDGFAAGFADGRALAEHEAQRLARVLHNIEAALSGLEHNVADQLLTLAVDLARAVIRHELNTRPDALRELVQEALRTLPESITSGEIQVHPSDIDLVKDYLHESGYNGNWRVIADARIEAGGCRIATRACDIDATLRTRWNQVIQTLGRTDGWDSERRDV